MTTSVVAVAREEARACRDRIASVACTAASSLRPSVSVIRTTGSVERGGAIEQHAHVRLQPAVREHDDGVARARA